MPLSGKNIASLKNKLYYSTPSNLLSVSLNVDFVFEALSKAGVFPSVGLNHLGGVTSGMTVA